MSEPYPSPFGDADAPQEGGFDPNTAYEGEVAFDPAAYDEQGAYDPAAYGADAAGYAAGGAYPEAEAAYGEEAAYDPGAAYDQGQGQGYEQAAYDPNAAYDQQAYAEGQGYDQAAYDPNAAYEQQGYEQAAYDPEAAYAEGQGYEQGYDPNAAYDPNAYAEGQGYEQAADYGNAEYADEYGEAEGAADDEGWEEVSDEDEAADAASAGKKKRVALVAAALAVLTVGGGAAAVFTGLVDPAPLLGAIPFLGPKDSPEQIAQGQANAALVQRAIEAYAAREGRVPRRPPDILKEIRELKGALTNPYSAEAPIGVEIAAEPTMPGSVALVPLARGYELRLGAADGKTLTIDGQPYVLTGQIKIASKPPMATPHQQAAPKPGGAPAPGAAPAPASPAPAAAAPTPSPEPSDKLLALALKQAQSMTPEEKQKVLKRAQIEKNQEFDRWRSKAIALVYESRTHEALGAFKKAHALRPEDESIVHWIAAIQTAVDARAMKPGDDRPAADSAETAEGLRPGAEASLPPLGELGASFKAPPVLPPTPSRPPSKG